VHFCLKIPLIILFATDIKLHIGGLGVAVKEKTTQQEFFVAFLHNFNTIPSCSSRAVSLLFMSSISDLISVICL